LQEAAVKDVTSVARQVWSSLPIPGLDRQVSLAAGMASRSTEKLAPVGLGDFPFSLKAATVTRRLLGGVLLLLDGDVKAARRSPHLKSRLTTDREN